MEQFKNDKSTGMKYVFKSSNLNKKESVEDIEQKYKEQLALNRKKSELVFKEKQTTEDIEQKYKEQLLLNRKKSKLVIGQKILETNTDVASIQITEEEYLKRLHNKRKESCIHKTAITEVKPVTEVMTNIQMIENEYLKRLQNNKKDKCTTETVLTIDKEITEEEYLKRLQDKRKVSCIAESTLVIIDIFKEEHIEMVTPSLFKNEIVKREDIVVEEKIIKLVDVLKKCIFGSEKLLWNDRTDRDSIILLLQKQGENETFDPTIAYLNTLSDEDKDKQRLDVIVQNNIGKSSSKQKKAIKGPSKSALAIIEKNKKDKNDDKMNNDVLMIESFKTEIKKLNNVKTVHEIAHWVVNMNTFENKLKVFDILIENITDEKIKKILYIEVIRRIETDNITIKRLKDNMKKIERVFTPEQVIQFQLKEMEDLMPPFSPFEKNIKKLDPWQLSVFEHIQNRDSIFIDAPTSSGKTICATYCIKVVEKTLFLVPTKELANQVAGTIRKMKTKTSDYIPVALITSDICYHDLSARVIVGTPKDIENWLDTENTVYNQTTGEYNLERNIDQIDISEFEYLIVDEIHQMNHTEHGPYMQRLIKRFNCPMLGLSATVGNADEITRWMKYLNSNTSNQNVFRISYNKRFINQDKFLWDGSHVNNIHPCAVIDLDFLQEDKLLNCNMPFTPTNSFKLFEEIKKIYGSIREIEEIKPVIFFPNACITLDSCKEYEQVLKIKLTQLSRLYPELTEQLLESFKVEDVILEKLDASTVYKMLKNMQQKKMLPAIVFKFEQSKCQNISHELLLLMKNMETKKYPEYKKFRELQNEHYKMMNEEIEKLKDLVFKKDIDIQSEKVTKTKEIQEKMLIKFKEAINVKCERLIREYTELLKTEQNEDNIKLYTFYIKNYNQDIIKYNVMTDLEEVNIYAPHPDFTFSNTTISVNTMIEVKKLLKYYLKQEGKGIKITYDHIFLQMIERGIVLYLTILPVPFQRVAQMLIANGAAPVTFSDESLSCGINYQIRSVVLLGSVNNDTIDTIIAHQASGRSGRRGLDTKGNVIYCGVNWRDLYRTEYLKITGANPDTPYMTLPKYFNYYFDANDTIKSLAKVSLADFISLESEAIVELEANRNEQLIEESNEIFEKYENTLISAYKLKDIEEIDIINEFLLFLSFEMHGGLQITKYDLFDMLTGIIDHQSELTYTDSLLIDKVMNRFTESMTRKDIFITYIHCYDLSLTYKMKKFELEGFSQDTISINIERMKKIAEIVRKIYNDKYELEKTHKWIVFLKEIFIDCRNLIFKHMV